MTSLGPSLTAVAKKTESAFAWSKDNLPKQLFINNEVGVSSVAILLPTPPNPIGENWY